jgi:cell division protein FtsL
MTDRRVQRSLSSRLFLLFLLAGALLYLGLGFVRQAAVNRQRQQALDQIEQEIATAQEELARWDAELERAQSPQAAEEWARESGWTKPDEASVVVISPSMHESPEAEGSPGEDTGPVLPRDAWWELFFGSR